jgi:RNA polymerase sigma factor (sigma-70 family)
MNPNLAPVAAEPDSADPDSADPDSADPELAVAALYEAHALSLIRLAHIMLGSQAAAEDVVQDAFCGLFRRWSALTDPEKALGYLRSSVLNGCRSVQRAAGKPWLLPAPTPGDSAEAAVLASERNQEIIAALRALPSRQREVLVLRYYLGIEDDQIARDLRMNPSTIRSARRRGIAALKRALKETP